MSALWTQFSCFFFFKLCKLLIWREFLILLSWISKIQHIEENWCLPRRKSSGKDQWTIWYMFCIVLSYNTRWSSRQYQMHVRPKAFHIHCGMDTDNLKAFCECLSLATKLSQWLWAPSSQRCFKKVFPLWGAEDSSKNSGYSVWWASPILLGPLPRPSSLPSFSPVFPPLLSLHSCPPVSLTPSLSPQTHHLQPCCARCKTETAPDISSDLTGSVIQPETGNEHRNRAGQGEARRVCLSLPEGSGQMAGASHAQTEGQLVSLEHMGRLHGHVVVLVGCVQDRNDDGLWTIK